MSGMHLKKDKLPIAIKLMRVNRNVARHFIHYALLRKLPSQGDSSVRLGICYLHATPSFCIYYWWLIKYGSAYSVGIIDHSERRQ